MLTICIRSNPAKSIIIKLGIVHWRLADLSTYDDHPPDTSTAPHGAARAAARKSWLLLAQNRGLKLMHANAAQEEHVN